MKEELIKHCENFNKAVWDIKKFQTEVIELKNIISKLKNIVEGFNSKLDEAEEK